MFAAADLASTQSDRSGANVEPDSSWTRSGASTSTSARKGLRVEVGQGKLLLSLMTQLTMLLLLLLSSFIDVVMDVIGNDVGVLLLKLLTVVSVDVAVVAVVVIALVVGIVGIHIFN